MSAQESPEAGHGRYRGHRRISSRLGQDFAPLRRSELRCAPASTFRSSINAQILHSRFPSHLKHHLETAPTVPTMAVKRSADELDVARTRPRREQHKRVRLSPSAEARSNSSEPSSCSVSEASALQSSPPVSTHDRISSMSSLEPTDSASDTDSSVSSESDSDLSDSESESDQEDIVTIGGPKKPAIGRTGAADGYDDLKTRLAAFLPQLEEANGLLTSEGGQWSMEDVEEGEQHIEMDLRLGVLEEQDEDEDGSNDSDSEDLDGEDAVDGEPDLPVSSGATKRSPKGEETRYMETLTGRCKEEQNVGIEEIG